MTELPQIVHCHTPSREFKTSHIPIW